MPIKDYKHIAEISKKTLFDNPNISESNKECIKRYLQSWNVEPATEDIFFRHIPRSLELIKDLKKDMHDPDIIEPVFDKLKEKLGKSEWDKSFALTKQVAVKLNDGEVPKGFKNIKRIPRKKLKRDLKPADMVTWEDGLKLAKATTSVQMKAIILTELDGGMRPSEFVDMNYGDCDTSPKDFIIARVTGKIGSRDVILFRCVPYLMRWLQMHPTKKKTDSLWIMENSEKSHPKEEKKEWSIRRYDYRAMSKRLELLGKKIKLNKPLYFYNLRHSGCTIAKKDNLNPELAADKFGHSVAHYTGTYGRLDVNGVVDRFKKSYGVGKQGKLEVAKNKRCPVCEHVNEPESDVCEKCGKPLSIKKALEVDKDNKKKISDLENQIKEMPEQIMKLMNEQVKDLKKALELKEGGK